MPRITAIAVLAALALSCALAAQEDKPTSEPAVTKNDLPEELTRDCNLYSSSQLRYLRQELEKTINLDPPPHYPIWTFELAKDTWHPGEMLYGRLTVKNVDKNYRFIFLPPCHGAMVDTVEVWSQKTGGKEKLTRAWPFLKTLIGGGSNYVRCGVPVILKPGQIYEALIPVNSYWSDERGYQENKFFGASVMNRPGEYRFYLRYFSWRGDKLPRDNAINRPQAGVIYPILRKLPPGELKKLPKTEVLKVIKLTDNPAIELEEKPIILGPFTVKIKRWPGVGQNNAARKVVGLWDHIEYEPSDVVRSFPPPDHKLVKELLGAFPASTTAPNSIGAMLKLYSWTAEYPDLVNPGYNETPEDRQKNIQLAASMLEDLRAMKADEKPGVLRDLMSYWEVRALLDLGHRSEALKLARENPTPDIIMLIAVRIGLRYNDKWRDNGAPYSLPADDYTDPSFFPIDRQPQPATRTYAHGIRPRYAKGYVPPPEEPPPYPRPPIMPDGSNP